MTPKFVGRSVASELDNADHDKVLVSLINSSMSDNGRVGAPPLASSSAANRYTACAPPVERRTCERGCKRREVVDRLEAFVAL